VLGYEAAVLDACRLGVKSGEVAMVGVPWVKRSEIPVYDVLRAIFNRYPHLRSRWEWKVLREPTEFMRGSIRENIKTAMSWFVSGRLSSAGITHRVDPRDCDASYRELKEQPRGVLAVIFDRTVLEDA
jgi:hypothetical protein